MTAPAPVIHVTSMNTAYAVPTIIIIIIIIIIVVFIISSSTII